MLPPAQQCLGQWGAFRRVTDRLVMLSTAPRTRLEEEPVARAQLLERQSLVPMRSRTRPPIRLRL